MEWSAPNLGGGPPPYLLLFRLAYRNFFDRSKKYGIINTIIGRPNAYLG